MYTRDNIKSTERTWQWCTFIVELAEGSMNIAPGCGPINGSYVPFMWTWSVAVSARFTCRLQVDGILFPASLVYFLMESISDVRGLTIKSGNSPPCACRASSGQKPHYGLMTLAYQRFTAVLLLIYGCLSEWRLLLSECVLVSCITTVHLFTRHCLWGSF
jgi:hypothetical protein